MWSNQLAFRPFVVLTPSSMIYSQINFAIFAVLHPLRLPNAMRTHAKEWPERAKCAG